MAYARTEWVGAAVATTLTASMDNSQLTASIAASTGWPTGGTGKWTVVLDRGTASEEQIEVTSRSSLTLTLSSRGFNGTTAASHSSGTCTVEVIAGKRDYDEANYAVTQTVGQIAAKGDLLGGSSANTLAKLAVGTNQYALHADSTQTTGLRWGLADPGGSTYTPTLTQSGAVTKTVTYANHVVDGKMVHWSVVLTCTGSGTSANAVTLGLPVAARSGASQPVAYGRIVDSATAANSSNGTWWATSGSSTCILLCDGVAETGYGVAPANGLQSGDLVIASGFYWSA